MVTVPPASVPDKRTSKTEAPKPPTPKSEPETASQGKTPMPKETQPSSRALASLELTRQGKALIEQNRLDAAIRALERAINIDPQNGQNYFYLAEAWLKKGDLPQAREFHHLAEMHLHKDAQWFSKLKIQKMKIKNF
jgi:tetratricopeptide (TPR) repeat protein